MYTFHSIVMHSVTFDILNKTSVFGILVPNSKVDIIICISKITNKFIRINIKVASFYYAKCLQSVGALLKLREMQCVSFAFSKRGERNKFCMIYHACLLSLLYCMNYCYIYKMLRQKKFRK